MFCKDIEIFFMADDLMLLEIRKNLKEQQIEYQIKIINNNLRLSLNNLDGQYISFLHYNTTSLCFLISVVFSFGLKLCSAVNIDGFFTSDSISFCCFGSAIVSKFF